MLSQRCLLIAVFLAGLCLVSWSAWAQEGEMVNEPDAMPAAAAPETQPESVSDAAAPPAAQKSYLMWMIEASGPFGAMIFICSFIMVALIVMNLLELRRDNFLPLPLLEAFEEHLSNKNYQAAYDVAKADESLVARVLAAGMAKLSIGYEQSVESMQEVGDDENMALEHRLSYLGLIAQLSPMLGLLGTVQGMISAFRVIATSTTAPKPYELADGIATALFTTLEGLCVAIPAMIGFLFIRNRISRLMFEVANVSDALMSRFAKPQDK